VQKNKDWTMKRIFIWIFIILAVGFVLLLIFRKSIISEIAFGDLHPREPKNEIAVTYEIGWWSYQDELRVDSFTVKTIESKLNLFNSESLISYTTKGILTGKKGWKPCIEKVHICQRFIREYNRKLHPYLDKDTVELPEALIEITPIVQVTEDKDYKGEKLSFKFTNELKINSFHWGNNWLRIQCGEKYEDIILRQRK
jgi:hypothetical protein